MKTLITSLCFCLLAGTLLQAQTTLNPGDIAFTGYNADDESDFSFVLLKDVVSGTTLTFTDDEYNNSASNALNTGEGRVTLTFNGSFSCGDEFFLERTPTSVNPAPWTAFGPTGSTTNLSVTNSASTSMSFSSSGDAIFAFQDNNPGTTTNPARFVAGLNMTGLVWTLGSSSNDTQLPPSLTNGQTANALTPEIDNAKYNCSTKTSTPAALATAINTQSNWPNRNNDTAIPLNGTSFCTFVCGASCTDPVLTSLNASPNPVCIGSATTINIVGTLNGSGAWSLRIGSCIATAVQTTTNAGFSVSPTVNTTYFVTAPNCDGTTQVCQSIAVTVSGVAANAGPDQLTPGTSTTLAGNSPGAGAGTWSIISGTGGSIDSPNGPTSSFSGTAGQAYTLRWTIDSGVCGTSSDDVKISFSSPTALAIGDIAFTQVVTDNPDYFTIVILEDILAGTEVHFTERGWFSTGGFRGGEGTLTATWCAAFSCGTQFRIVDNTGFGTDWSLLDAGGNVAGTVLVSGGSSFALSIAGDQIFAYQGSEPTTNSNGNFLAAIHMNGDWETDATSATTSDLPDIFVSNPNTSIAPFSVNRDNGAYNCAVTSGSKATLLAGINNPSNWPDNPPNNDDRPATPTFCNFSCQACVEPTIAGASQNPNPVCAGSTVTITVGGNLNGAARWVIYDDVCGGNEVATSTTASNPQISFTVNTGGTYFVAGVDGCVVTPTCSSFTINVDGVVADAGSDAKVPQGTTTTTLTGNTPPGGATVSWSYAGAAGTGDGNGVIASPSSQSTSFSGTAGQSYTLRYTISKPGCPPTSDEVLVAFLDPTDLSLGEIAFIAYNSNTDNFAFVPLVDINAGTQITFTERGWLSGGGFNNSVGENTFTMEFCRAYPCGSEIDVFMVPDFLILDVNGNTAATVSSGTALQLSSSGDQIFAYQGSEPTGGNQSNFLAAIQMNGAWDSTSNSAGTSAQPSIFTDGINSISIDPEAEEARYDCVSTGPAAGPSLALLLNNASNWNSRDNNPYPLPLNCGISCCEAPSITSASANPSEFCPGEMVTLTVVGTLGGGTTWVWYEGSCGSATVAGSGAVIMVSPTATTTYHVRAEGGCLSNEACTSVTATLDQTPPTINCPGDVNTNNDAGQCSAVVNYIPPSGSDNCPGASSAQTAGLGSGAAFPVGMTTETYTVTATNGQTASCSFTVTVYDNENPEITCVTTPANRDTDPGECSYTAQGAEFDATATDNCAVTSLTNNYNNSSTLAGETFPVGATQVRWTATDAIGNFDTCSVKIVVADNELPLVTCQDITVELGTNGTFSIASVGYINANVIVTKSDNCGLTGNINVPYGSSSLMFTCDNVGILNPTAIGVKDINGNNSGPCNFNVTVTDPLGVCNQPPVANCKDVTVNADGNCQGAAVAADFNDGSTDPDGDPLTFSVNPAGPYALGVTNVTLTVSDGQDTDQCTATITVVDNTDPVADCSAINPNRNNDPGQCNYTMPGTGFDATATDNCGVTSLTNDYNNISSLAGETFPVGSTPVVWTALDAAGNSNSCTINIVIADTEAPVADCSAINPNRNNDAGQCSYTMPGTGFDATATDNCGVTSLTNDYNNGSSLAGATFPVGTTTVTWTAVDAAGNSHTCAVDIVISDTEDPVADCSAINPNRNNDAGECSYTMPGTGFDATAMDNCGVTSLTNDYNNGSSLAGEAFPVGTTTVTWTAVDAAGNSHTCSIDIVITDNEKPSINCPANFTVDNDPGLCGADVTIPSATAIDNCPGQIILKARVRPIDANGDPTGPWSARVNDPSGYFAVGRYRVQWRAEDQAGNRRQCSFIFKVRDAEKPSIDCPANFTVDNDPGLCGADVTIPSATATDNCPGPIILKARVRPIDANGDPTGPWSARVNDPSGYFAVGRYRVQWRAEDQAGNRRQCSFIFEVLDAEDPVADCSAINPSRNSDPGLCSFTMPGSGFDAAATDNCAVTSLTNDYNNGSSLAGETFPVGTTTVIWTAMDAAGNSHSCTIDIVITDNEDPVADCSEIDDKRNNDPGLCSFTMPGTGFDATATDNCGVTSLTNDYNSGSTLAGETFPVGTTTVVWTALDAQGNSHSCSIDIVITDDEDPDITICTALPLVFNSEQSVSTEDYINFAATDNCEIGSITYSPETISCEQLGELVSVTVTVTDIYGNASTCVTNIFVDGLPCGFMVYDDHIDCSESEASYDVQDETFTLTSVNCYYVHPWRSDEAAYVKSELCDDGEIIAHVEDIDGNGWAGIVFRESNAHDSKKFAISTNLSNFARREKRTFTGGPSNPQQFPAFNKYWLRLTRSGNLFRGYIGVEFPVGSGTIFWQQAMAANIQMNSCIEAGLFVTNYSPNGTVVATFGNVSVTESGNNNLQVLTPQLDIPSLELAKDVLVYPNPATGVVYVDLANFAEQNTQLQLIDARGQLVLQRNLGKIDYQTEQLQVDNLPAGVYQLYIQTEDAKPITKRVVIQR